MQGRFYKKSLIMIFLVSGIPGLIIGALVYWIAGGRVESELLQLHYRQIEQRSQTIDEYFNNLELILSHWAFDHKFDSSLAELDVNKDYTRAQDITRTLLLLQGSNTMVKKVELYLNGKRPLLFDPEYTLVDPRIQSAIYSRLSQEKQITFWTQLAFDPNRPEKKDLTLVHQIPGGSQEPIGVLLFRFDEQKIANLLKTLTPYSNGETFMIEDFGNLFVSADGSAMDSPIVSTLLKEIQNKAETKGSFSFNWNKETFTVSYGKWSRIAADWTYVSVSPITGLTSPVLFISKLIFVASLISLLIAALLAWLASRSIYSPVNRFCDELNRKMAEQLPYVKESFFHQLVHGYLYAYSEEDLLSRVKQFKWDVRDRHFIIVYVQLNGITSMDGKFRNGDEGLVTFAALNMMEELASSCFDQRGTINFHDLTAAIILHVPVNQNDRNQVQAYTEQLTQSINQLLRMRVTTAISGPISKVSDISLEFERVKQAVGYRNFDSDNQIIDMESNRIEADSDSDLQYPFILEREFIQAIRTGREEEAETLLKQFIEAVSGLGAKEIDVQQGVLQLLGSIQHVIMVSGINPNRLFKGINLYDQLSQIREPKLIQKWFQEKVITPFLMELLSRSDAHIKRNIEQAMIYLHNHYMRDISLDNCAEHIGINPYYLSKSFKQITGKNFIDYLTELRLEKAKELLRDTELKINDVAEQVGYQHTYFNRIFKKTEGMTPSQYRELSFSM